MQKLWRPLLLLTVVLFVPVLPFLLFGRELEPWVTEWFQQQTSSVSSFALLIGLLTVDIFLPIPSSVLSTLGGARLGWLIGTLGSWLGMTLSAALGFSVARRWGRPVALRLAKESDLDGMQDSAVRWGTLVLVVTRPLPIVADASVLLFGLHRLEWRQFLPPILFSNLGIALAYSAFGDWAAQHAWLPMALGISIALPLFIGLAVQRWYRKKKSP